MVVDQVLSLTNVPEVSPRFSPCKGSCGMGEPVQAGWGVPSFRGDQAATAVFVFSGG